jgi:hypothetical protein
MTWQLWPIVGFGIAAADASELEAPIDAPVFALCGLSEDEIKVVEDSVGAPKGGAKS